VVLRELRKLGELQAYISELDRMDLLDEEEDIDEAEMNDRDETKSIRCASIDNFQGEGGCRIDFHSFTFHLTLSIVQVKNRTSL
jgi:hypothetical protein